jgi:hypothetical protein
MSRPRVLINGYGRIGRLAHRRALGWHHDEGATAPFDVVWVNELGAVESAAYLLQFDSTHGRWGETTVAEDGSGFTVKSAGGTVDVGYSRAATPAEVSERGKEPCLAGASRADEKKRARLDHAHLTSSHTFLLPAHTRDAHATHARLSITPLTHPTHNTTQHRSPGPKPAPSTWSSSARAPS